MNEVPVNLANAKTRRTTQLMRLARNRTRGKVGPYITKVKRKISDPQQLVDYLETKNTSGRTAFSYAQEGNLRFLKETDLSRFILSKLWSSARREFSSPAPSLPSIENRLRAATESKGGFLKRTRKQIKIRNRVR
jgi:hypothetical protein